MKNQPTPTPSVAENPLDTKLGLLRNSHAQMIAKINELTQHSLRLEGAITILQEMKAEEVAKAAEVEKTLMAVAEEEAKAEQEAADIADEVLGEYDPKVSSANTAGNTDDQIGE